MIKTLDYIIIPGKFKFHDAIEIVKLLKTEYRIPTVEEGVRVIKENDYLLGLKTLITNEAKEFGEDGNWIYVAQKTTNLSRTMRNQKEGYVAEYKRHPVRNGYFDLVLIKGKI